jgi:hypothetical protein
MGDHDCSSQSNLHDRPHDEVRASLPEYAAAQAIGQGARARFPAVAAHLDGCSICRAEFETLLELAVLAYTGEIVPAKSAPHFDLSFLEPQLARPAKTRQTWLVDDLRRLVISFSDVLFASMQPLALAQATRGEILYHYTPDPPPGNFSVTIDVFAGDDDPQLGNVQVLVDVPGRDPFDQSGIRVTLHAGELIWEKTTSETGSATFMAIPLHLLPHLRVEISYPPEA